jgi:chaperonin GroES
MSLSKVRTLNELVLIEPVSEEQKTASGIILIEQARKRKPKRGTVVRSDDPAITKVQVGEVILYPQGSGTEVQLDGKTYELVPASSLMLVI